MRLTIRAWLNHFRDRLETWAARIVLDAFSEGDD